MRQCQSGSNKRRRLRLRLICKSHDSHVEMKKVMFVFGTRPEAIKLHPVIKKFKKSGDFKIKSVSTGQHGRMMNPILKELGLNVDIDLKIMRPGQSLCQMTARILKGMEQVYLKIKPDMVLVHGDTTTAFAASLAAFYLKIPVGHVEAGLRSWDMNNPFPEEANRVFISRMATLHFAPTTQAKKNLLKEMW